MKQKIQTLQKKPDKEHKTHKKRPELKIVRNVVYECAYVTVMAFLIIFPLPINCAPPCIYLTHILHTTEKAP